MEKKTFNRLSLKDVEELSIKYNLDESNLVGLLYYELHMFGAYAIFEESVAEKYHCFYLELYEKIWNEKPSQFLIDRRS